MRTIIEPFRIKSVEPLHPTSTAEREHYLEQAGYNLFLIEASHILIDLLTATDQAGARERAGFLPL